MADIDSDPIAALHRATDLVFAEAWRTARTVAEASRATFVPAGTRACEVSYNAGRMFHEMGLLQLAIPRYADALSSRSSWGGPDAAPAAAADAHSGEAALGAAADRFDVGREAAFNLSLVLRAAGQAETARALLRRFLSFEIEEDESTRA